MSRTIRRKGLFSHLKWDNYKHTKEQFHRDAGNKYYVDYNSASWCYRNTRNRQLRYTHKREVCGGQEVLTPFIHNAGWDEW